MKRILTLLTCALLFVVTSCGSDNDDNFTATTCEESIVVTAAAASDFASATSDNYTELCTAYKASIEAQIQVCGDTDGSLQTQIDNLGDCTEATLEVEISLTAGTLPVDFDVVNVVVDGNILRVTGETSVSNNYTIYFEVVQGETGVDVINSTFELSLTSIFYPSTQGFEDFTSTITVNTDGTLTGSFGGVVTNANGGDLNLSAGSINITY